MKKIICLLFLTVAFTTNAQTLTFTGDSRYSDVWVEIIVDGVSYNINNYVDVNQPASFTLPLGADLNSVYIIARTQDSPVYIETDDTYYDLYINYFNETGNHFDNPENPYVYQPYFDGSSNYNYFIGSLPGYLPQN